MNSHDLAEEILALPPYEVFVAPDSEWNNVKPLSEFSVDYVVKDEEGTFTATVDEHVIGRYVDTARQAIVIWPTS